jgi:hypothetical protein
LRISNNYWAQYPRQLAKALSFTLIRGNAAAMGEEAGRLELC